VAQNVDPKVREKVWLTPDQIDDLQQRNEAIVALMYDTGLRIVELVTVNVGMLREQQRVVFAN